MDVTITISAHESNVYRSNPRASAIRTAVNLDEIAEICRESRKKIAFNLHEIAEMKAAIAKNAEKTATKSWCPVCFIIENGAGGRQNMRKKAGVQYVL